MNCKRKLGPTDIKYKIICAGSGFDVGCGKQVIVVCNGKTYNAKMHSKTKGRIDGLSQLYIDFNLEEGQEIELTYNDIFNVVSISTLNGNAHAFPRLNTSFEV